MGYGGYGGGMGYGGMGMGYGGYGSGMGMFPGQPQLDANGQPIPTLTQTLESTTQHTFGLIHSIVQTFSGVAQMLESTFMATHSSFFAMVGVIEQFGHLRNALGSVLGLFGLVRYMRELLTGRPAGAARLEGEFRDFVNGRPIPPAGAPGAPPQKYSKKPIIIFLLAVLGVPYAMTKLIRILAKRQQEQQALLGGPLPPLDPSTLTFARALYPFEPTNPAELGLKENEIVAIMGKLDPRTGGEADPRLDIPDAEWWKGRTRDGREGWFPRKWVEIIERKEKKVDP
ncbi:Peroxin 13, N-terminal region-domain-containing protein [Schizophyllum commune]